MEINEILGKLADRQVGGMMIHEQMADLFDLLNLHGYKRWHEYRFLEESINMRLTKRFCVAVADKIALTSDITDPKGLPSIFINKLRKDVSDKLDIVKGAFEKIATWEKDTLKLLNDLYISSQQIKAGEVAQFIMQSIKHVAEELKYINRELQTLRDVSNLDIIIEKQDKTHDEYKDKIKSITEKLYNI